MSAGGWLADRRRDALVLATALLAVAAAACGSRTPTTPGPVPGPSIPQLPIMGAARLTPAQIVAWVNGRQPQPPGTYAATVPIDVLAAIYIDEGTIEGVTGDVAFMQSVVETGWFRFSGVVPAHFNNFAGIGATDAGGTPAMFPDARIGVRAQIQHLRAYADPTALTCTVPPLARPCVDPRFHLVLPKGRAPMWNQLGNGNWATAGGYGTSIVTLFQEALRFSGTAAVQNP